MDVQFALTTEWCCEKSFFCFGTGSGRYALYCYQSNERHEKFCVEFKERLSMHFVIFTAETVLLVSSLILIINLL